MAFHPRHSATTRTLNLFLKFNLFEGGPLGSKMNHVFFGHFKDLRFVLGIKVALPALKKKWHFFGPAFEKKAPPPGENYQPKFPPFKRSPEVGRDGWEVGSPPGACIHCSKEASKVHLGPVEIPLSLIAMMLFLYLLHVCGDVSNQKNV